MKHRRHINPDKIARRDGMVCADCGWDMQPLTDALHWADRLAFAKGVLPSDWAKVLMGFPPGRRLFDIDHTHPLAEGGEDSEENCRILCVPCHKRATGKLATRRAKVARIRLKGPRVLGMGVFR